MSCDFSGDEPADTPDRQPDGDSTQPDQTSKPTTLASARARETIPVRLAEDCLILAGPTAAGKSAISLPLAKRLNAEIVSVDSMAVYRGLDIGTAKPTAAERELVPHHVIDVVDANASFSVAAWLASVATAVEEIRRRGRRILFVGGTPLYLKALREGLADRPSGDPALRAALAERLEREGSAALHRELAKHDPAAAERIHPNDAKRIVRAIEVACSAPTQPNSSSQAAWGAEADPAAATPLLILDLPRQLLNERIATRVRKMFSEGLVDEVETAEATVGIGDTARQGAGYSEVLAMLAGEISRQEAIEQTIRRTRQLAKRQRTWFRSFHNAVWICS